MKELEDLAQRWLEEAETLARYRDERGAEVCRMHAAELGAAIESHESEALTLVQAADASGYSTEHLRHLVSNGTIPNAGRKGSPRIRRGDLPLKPGNRASDGFDAAAEAQKIIGSIGEKRA